MTQDTVKITFLGGAGDVTGSNFLLETTTLQKNIRILIDCGMFQGDRLDDERNRAPFQFDPASIDALFVTHSHIDHVGRIPKLVKDGFRGVIYSTPPTRDLAELMMIDSLGVLTKDAKHLGKAPFFSEQDVTDSLKDWKTLEYGEKMNMGPVGITLRDAGHVLGSAMIEFHYNSKKIVFTGDLGNSPAPLLRDTEIIKDANVLLVESVYGDRNHETKEERKRKLEGVIEDTIKKKGTLMIPAFSLERTQEILYEIENMMEQNRIPLVPVYVDSPLAIKITDVYKKYDSSDKYFNKQVRYIINSGNDIFSFAQVLFTRDTEDSKQIDKSDMPKIIIAGSGMSNGGRILHHEKRFLPDPNSTLLLIGYQAAGTLGRRLQEGQKQVRIAGEEVSVRARIETIGGYSAHKDSEHLLEFVASSADSLEHVYTILGEPKSSMFLVQRIRDYLGIRASAPVTGDIVEIKV
jgi:metallo-beta-lactamase family protein